MENRPLQHPLKTQGRLGLPGLVVGDYRRGLLDKSVDIAAQLFRIGAAGLQDLGGSWIVQQRQQEVLHRHELMATLPGPLEGLVQREFQLFAQHTPRDPRYAD